MKKILVCLIAFSSMYYSNADAWNDYDYRSNRNSEKHHKQNKKHERKVAFDKCSLKIETNNNQQANVMINIIENSSAGNENDRKVFYKSSSSSQQMIERQFQSLDELDKIFYSVTKSYKTKKNNWTKSKKNNPRSFFGIVFEQNFDFDEGMEQSNNREIEIKVVSNYTETDIQNVLSKHIKCDNITINGVPFVHRNDDVIWKNDEAQEIDKQQVPVIIRNANQDVIESEEHKNVSDNDGKYSKTKFWTNETKGSTRIETSVEAPDSSVTFRFENKMPAKYINENIVKYAKITGDIVTKRLNKNVNCVWNAHNNEVEIYVTGENSYELNKNLSFELSRLHKTVDENVFTQTANKFAPACSLSKFFGKECNSDSANFAEYKEFLNTFNYEPKLNYIAKGYKER